MQGTNFLEITLLCSSEDRLPKLANECGGWFPINGVPVTWHPRWAYGFLFTHLVAFFTNVFGQLPVGSQRPFELGTGPIQPIMNSRCLSAAGFRLFRHPIPPGDFRFTYDPPTGLLRAARTSWGLPRSAIAGDAIGLGALSAAWALGIRVRQPGNCGFLPKALGISQLAQGLPNATSTKDSLSFAMPIFPWP